MYGLILAFQIDYTCSNYVNDCVDLAIVAVYVRTMYVIADCQYVVNHMPVLVLSVL